jgi:hypothetical protein
MRFKGAMGGAAVGDDYPDHEPRLDVPFKRYKELENTDPKLYEAITHVAKDQRVPPDDLAAIVYASSQNQYNARDGNRVGYAGLTPDDVQQLDPHGEMDVNNPIDNLFLGAAKYKALSRRFGEGTAHTFAAYHGGPDTVDTLLSRHPDEHASTAPPGMFEFVNRVLGRGPQGEGSGVVHRLGRIPVRVVILLLVVAAMVRQAAGQPAERETRSSQRSDYDRPVRTLPWAAYVPPWCITGTDRTGNPGGIGRACRAAAPPQARPKFCRAASER